MINTPAPLLEKKLSDLLAFAFVVVILLYAASGPLSDVIRWIVEITSPGFDELSRRQQRIAFKNHVLGQMFRNFERGFLLPTGLILGLPVVFSFALTFLTLHQGRGSRWLNGAAAGACLAVFGVWIANLFALDDGLLPSLHSRDFWLFSLAVILTLYLTWQLFGGFIVAFCLFWIVYCFIRGDLPQWTGVFAGSEATLTQTLRLMVANLWLQTGGLFGQPLQIVSGNVLIFIVFGSILMACGAGELLMKIANRITGGLTGGAAHAAVASSALFGTLSGAAISNVVSTGVMTIPVIRRAGFKPTFAAAVEAAASTGGSIMPPVMGVVAFFVAGQIGLEYRYIIVAAIMPALFYYLGTFMTVYFEAKRLGIGPLPAGQRPPLTGIEQMRCLIFIVPLGVLTTFLFIQPSIPKAGFYGFLTAVICATALFPTYRSWHRLYRSLVEGGRMAALIVIIVTAIGLVVDLIQMSGFSTRLSLLLAQLATGPLFSVLIAVALGSIVLGMGLPPGATYFVIVIALGSGIEAVGIAPLTLHLFVVFFAVMSTVTPPVALAAFAAAPIAGANPLRTGLQAARLSLAGFLIPFVFVYHPALLYKLQVLFEWFGADPVRSPAMIDISSVSWGGLGWITFAFTLAMWLLTSALSGFEQRPLPPIERAARGGLAFALLVPQWIVAAPALVISLLLIAKHRLSRNDSNHNRETQNHV